MQMAQHFEDISIDDILSVAEREHEAHSRFVQVLCINGEEGIDLVYSYQKTVDQGYAVHNYRVHGVKPETRIPSVTKFYLVAFPFENEAHDLFGVQVDDIAIDFKGGFYKVAMDKPMTVISPAQKAAREKAAKLAAAKAAKAAKAAQEAASKTKAAAGEGAQAVSDSFDIDDYTRWRLLEGLDDIGITLGHEADIAAYEARRPAWKPSTL